MLQPVPKQEGRTVVVVNSPRTPMGPVPVRPPPGPELSTQPTPGAAPPVLPAPLMVSASPVGPPLIPASRPPGPVLLPPLQPNSGPLPQGELQGGQPAGGLPQADCSGWGRSKVISVEGAKLETELWCLLAWERVWSLLGAGWGSSRYI